ncbi:MAG: hypothetical protein M3Y60_14715, partial [Bacteroidota bacterium]|nr:hypothetical protein [Bacteroidota bacterium]
MSGTAAIDSNLQALRRILAGLFAMAGLLRNDAGSASPSDQEKSSCEGDEEARRGSFPPPPPAPRHPQSAAPRRIR